MRSEKRSRHKCTFISEFYYSVQWPVYETVFENVDGWETGFLRDDVTVCIGCYISNKFLYSISLCTNSPDKGPLFEMLRIENF